MENRRRGFAPDMKTWDEVVLREVGLLFRALLSVRFYAIEDTEC